MTDQIVKPLTDPAFLIALLVGDRRVRHRFHADAGARRQPLKARMKSVALERDELRAKQRARLAAEADRRRKGLREEQSIGMQTIVERLDLRRALVDENTLNKLKMAGFRGQNPLTTLPVLPPGPALRRLRRRCGSICSCSADLPDQPLVHEAASFASWSPMPASMRRCSNPNRATKRKQSIQTAWPDALDLMLICVESGMSIEAAIRKVADEIGAQSVELAEESMLTNAELSFLPERKQAYENLAEPHRLESVRSVAQALVQAERYGTPMAHALRVLASESRDMRMNAAEKKAAALPPKLTVPMILFFLPVLFAVILGPAGIQVSERGIFGSTAESTEVGERSSSQLHDRHSSMREPRRDARALRERACIADARLDSEAGMTAPAVSRCQRAAFAKPFQLVRDRLVGLGLLLVAVLELLPGVLLRQHGAEIGDIGLRLLGGEFLAGDLLGLVEAALQADHQRQVLPDAAVGARLFRRRAHVGLGRLADRLPAHRTCRDWKAPRARSASGRAPCDRGLRACAALPNWSRIAPSAEASFQSGYSGVWARRTASSAGSNWPAPASDLP